MKGTKSILFVILILAITVYGEGKKKQMKIISIADRSQAYAICSQDDKMWFGTKNGAVLYDKLSGKITCFDDRDGLEGNHIFDIRVDPNGRVIAATNLGLFFLFDDKWTEVVPGDSLGSHYVTSITFDSSGDLWCGTSVGISHICQDNSVERFSPQNTGMASFFINDLIFDSEGNLWVAGKKSLTCRKDERWINYGFTSHYNMFAVSGSPHGLVAAGNLGLCFLNNTKYEIIKNQSGYGLENIRCILSLDDKQAMLGGKGLLAIAQFDQEGKLNYVKAIDTQLDVEDIYRDKNNQIWLATYTGVKFQNKESKWLDLDISNGFQEQNVTGIHHDGKTLFIGGDKGLFSATNRIFEPVLWDDGNKIGAVACLRGAVDNKIYLAADGYLGIIDGDRAIKLGSLKNSKLGDEIKQIKTYNDKIYCCSAKGIAFFADGAWSLVTDEYDIRDFIFYKKSLWLATATGAIKIRKRLNQHFLSTHTSLNCVIEDNGTLWFGAWNGLYSFKGNMKNQRKLVDAQVYSLAASPYGIIFGCSDKGVFALDQNHVLDWEDFYYGQKLHKRQKVFWLTAYDGLPTSRTSVVSIGNTGDVWLGAREGISCLHIKNILDR